MSRSDPEPDITRRRLNLALAALLALAIVRLWIVPLPSSFWTDEAGTVFVVRYAASHGWAAVSPQFPQSIYYALPRIAGALGGFSEVVYRLPSTLAMGAALILIASLAARLIHPEAAWFAVFACLALRGFNFLAADARPYGLGMAIMAAALWFLVRWLDRARWRDAALFVLFAALLWPVHPLYWPFYLVFTAYAIVRLASKETNVTWLRAGAVFSVLALLLAPVFVEAVVFAGRARMHVISPELPGPRALAYSLEPGLVAVCWAGAWLLSLLYRWSTAAARPARSSLVLIALWWLCCPLSLFAFSHLTGIGVFVPRYYSLALPGAALAATALAAARQRRLARSRPYHRPTRHRSGHSHRLPQPIRRGATTGVEAGLSASVDPLFSAGGLSGPRPRDSVSVLLLARSGALRRRARANRPPRFRPLLRVRPQGQRVFLGELV